jgi:signal transduction histidine kinase
VHEMNTPLTSIIASSELLRKEVPADTSILGRLARNIDISTHNLSRRVTELMNFARLQTGNISLQMELADMRQIIKLAREQTGELFQSQHQTLTLEIPDYAIWVEVDEDRISQVMMNLLTNASKFSVAPDKITVRAYRENNQAIIEVRDSAPPIDPEEKGMIFQPYYRRNKGKGSGGLGLGLFICQRLVQSHGGSIWTEEHADGNSFKFSLPLAQDVGEEE